MKDLYSRWGNYVPSDLRKTFEKEWIDTERHIDGLIDRKDLLEKYVEHLANAILNDDIDEMILISASAYLNSLDRIKNS